jgi:beta-carotene 3-hydroxylase
MLGSMYAVWPVMYIGFGILAYGIAYFLVHEVFIHQRFKWFRNSDNVYFRAIRRAHKVHHKHMGKEQGSVLVC